MPSEGPAKHGSPTRPIRLNGWKEIATYLERGVRTVQRWEKDVGLPVRRIGTGGGEVVYALVEEIDRWLDSAAAKRAAGQLPDPGGELGDPRPASSAGSGETSSAAVRSGITRRRSAWIASGAAVVLVAVAALTWVRLAHPAEVAQPASWKVAGNALVVLDGGGHVLWTYPFEFRLTDSAYQDRPAQNEDLRPVVIDDIDGDGNAEVLFVSEPWLPASRGLYCFDHRGWCVSITCPSHVVRFGEKTYDPPWRGAFVSAIGVPGRPHDVWFVSTHLEEFPTVIEKLDASGKVQGQVLEQWTDSRGCDRAARGRSVVFVGACSNEFKGGSLAVLDAERPSGAAPAATDHYRCNGCPTGSPLAFLVFPRLDVTAALRYTYSAVINTYVDTLGQILVDVRHHAGEHVAPELQWSATSQYTLDSQFRVMNAELGEKVDPVHRALEREGLLDHPFNPEYDSRFLWPVLRWDGATFVKITGPESRERRWGLAAHQCSTAMVKVTGAGTGLPGV